jgi:hypothetical protein
MLLCGLCGVGGREGGRKGGWHVACSADVLQAAVYLAIRLKVQPMVFMLHDIKGSISCFKCLEECLYNCRLCLFYSCMNKTLCLGHAQVKHIPPAC